MNDWDLLKPPMLQWEMRGYRTCWVSIGKYGTINMGRWRIKNWCRDENKKLFVVYYYKPTHCMVGVLKETQ